MIKKLYLSTFVFILLLFATTTATYAWLSMATSAAVQGLSLTTSLGDSLEISLDGINYYESLPSELLMNKIEGVRFTDVTSMNGKDFTFGIRQLESNPVRNRDYISVDFYFRTKSVYNHEVFLAHNISNEVTYEQGKVGTYIVSKGRNWSSDVDFLYGPDLLVEKHTTRKFYVHDALRVSFIEHSNDMKQKIFDLTGNEERGFGKAYGAHAYYAIKNRQISLPTQIPDTTYQLSEFDSKNPYALDNRSHILSLKYIGNQAEDNQYYYEGKVTMNIWAEGWDADLFDAVFGDQVKMQFQFKAVIGIKS